jgi:hypothetical protein
MVIVPDPIFVSGRRTRGLYTANDALLCEESEGIIDRLARYGANLLANHLGNIVRRAVRLCRDGVQHSDSLGRHVDPMVSEKLGGYLEHFASIALILDFVKICFLSTYSQEVGLGRGALPMAAREEARIARDAFPCRTMRGGSIAREDKVIGLWRA